jgi:hypothetical protein
MIFNPKNSHTCPCCQESKPRTGEFWLQADTRETLHQFACRDCLKKREANMKAQPVNLRNIMKTMRILERRIGDMKSC